MPGQLLTQYFLTDGIKETQEWESCEDTTAEFQSKLGLIYEEFKNYSHPNEATTEQDMIRPVLELLDWTDYLPQQGSNRNEDIPDYLLFPDVQTKERAAARTNAESRYLDATVVVENKRFGLALDTRDKADGIQTGTPHGQILRYLSSADIASNGNIQWGILTNGVLWRLYYNRTLPRATAYFETDIGTILESSDDTRLFQILFQRNSFIKQGGANFSFLENSLDESKRYEERVAQDLSSVVFESVFPSLIQALTNASDADLPTAREAALIFLYRMLFMLYAEDRGLLPVNDLRYGEYGLRKPVREDIANRMEQGIPFSTNATNYYDHLENLCRIVDQGDTSIGLPPYNGGLFTSATAPLLHQVRLTDEAIAPIIHRLSHIQTKEGPHFVNYRDMSVQQLGSIYERLLEREPVQDNEGKITVRPNSYARKDSGSYFTPQGLVDLIVDHTLTPLTDERRATFETRARELQEDDRSAEERMGELRELDPAEAILDLKVVDPAMGSGHFLVTAVDFLSDKIAELAEHPPATADWMQKEYTSPLLERVESIRQDIVQRAQESAWTLDEALLTDQTIIRRMVLKRCIYGVDKNPLTVELAKVSLWLHSFTVGAPLSFLDHHLRHGDSLVGLSAIEVPKELERLLGGSLFANDAITETEAAKTEMQRIEEISDADIAEVNESATLFQDVENTTNGLRRMMDTLNGIRWLTAGMKVKQRKEFEGPVSVTLVKDLTKAYAILQNGPVDVEPTENDPSWTAFSELWNEAKDIATREAFFHWEAAFPGVWTGWNNSDREGGFDAVIGNPPWDRIKFQEVEWFAYRSPDIALAGTAAARKAAIKKLRETDPPLAEQFDRAKERSEKMAQLARSSGQYPTLSSGDINLYSLFVERATSLVKPDGMIGLLTPSGIYADKTAADFFKSISTKGRIADLFDFENRKIFFKDIHASFKFCAMVFGGVNREFPETQCAFFLHDTETVNDQERCFPLGPEDFARVNPNTGTAPVFRTRRDADITRGIYDRHPVLVDRSKGEETRAWPVRYNRMFDMTNDSHMFRTAMQLNHDGFYPIEGNRRRKGDDLYLPLYQGRMIHQFDHRANSVKVNTENTHNPYLSEDVTDEQHADANFLPQPQFWAPVQIIQEILPQSSAYTVGFRDIARPTDVRTAIFSVVPWAGYGNTLPLLLCADSSMPANAEGLLVGNLNSFCVDFITRQKVQGTHLNWYIVEQLPVIGPDDYDREFGDSTARDLVRDHVLRLTYTAHDMAPFAKDMGYEGPPFIWNDEERHHLRARLDALYFHLYGVSREDAEYILSTFPIVQKDDEAKFTTYRTRDLILAYMNALAAGDTETIINL